MQQLQLPNVALTVNVEAFLGLTTWEASALHRPPYIGWWKTRRASCPNVLQPQRRWWDGHRWSRPVTVLHGDDEADEIALQPARDDINAEIEWCGLLCPHPDGYTLLIATPPEGI